MKTTHPYQLIDIDGIVRQAFRRKRDAIAACNRSPNSYLRDIRRWTANGRSVVIAGRPYASFRWIGN